MLRRRGRCCGCGLGRRCSAAAQVPGSPVPGCGGAAGRCPRHPAGGRPVRGCASGREATGVCVCSRSRPRLPALPPGGVPEAGGYTRVLFSVGCSSSGIIAVISRRDGRVSVGARRAAGTLLSRRGGRCLLAGVGVTPGWGFGRCAIIWDRGDSQALCPSVRQPR